MDEGEERRGGARRAIQRFPAPCGVPSIVTSSRGRSSCGRHGALLSKNGDKGIDVNDQKKRSDMSADRAKQAADGRWTPCGMSARDAARFHARLSHAYTLEAIVELLARSADRGLRLREIADALELPHAGEGWRFQDTALAYMSELRNSGAVEQPGGKGTPWKLTSEESARRA